ncbi:MAG: hypothetical protein M1830_008384 [Pleopsidium flavum]|nr:MAG: hypothetical protein M1830_008384 [Pleopsidium flavum]
MQSDESEPEHHGQSKRLSSGGDNPEDGYHSNTGNFSSDSDNSDGRHNTPVKKPAQPISKSQSPRKYRRTMAVKEYEEDLGPKLAELLLECRFYLLRYFTNEFSDSLIQRIFPDLESPSHLYDNVYRKVLSYCKNWKSVTMDAAIQHAEEMITLDAAGDHVLAHSDTDEAIGLFFAGRFSPENFTTVFPWLHKYLDVRRSSDLGRFYFKNVYANLMAQTVQHLRWLENGKIGDEYDRVALMHTFNGLGMDDIWKDLRARDFARLRPNTTTRRSKKPAPPPRAPRFVLYGKPPQRVTE